MSMSALSMATSNNKGGNIRNMMQINNNKDDAASLIQQRLLVLLPKQYNHLQDYCNAQISLENAWQLSQQQSKQQHYKSSDLLQAVAALQKATQRVQEDFQSLQTMVLSLSPSSSSSPSSSTTNKDHQLLQQEPSSSATNDTETTPSTRNRQRRHANTATAIATAIATATATAAGHNNSHHHFQWQVPAEQHLQRTRRILHNLQTPTGQFSTLGIPLPTGATKQEDTIVALATLRASVAQLQSVLEASKDNTV
jgi:hypothetical protein